MIDFAGPRNYSAVQQIWIDCFGDTEQYTSFLFHRLLKPENVLIHADEDGKPVAMLCFQTFTMRMPNGSAQGAYVFGVATLPEWRKRGFSSALLAEAEKRFQDHGISISTLVPAGPKLFEFYERQGFETAFSARRTVYADTDLTGGESCTLTPARLESLHGYRNEFFSDRTMFVDWSEDYLAYIDSEARALGGGTFSVNNGGESGYVVCYPYKEAVIVKELAVSDHKIESVLAALHAIYHASEYRIHLPEDVRSDASSKTGPFAMAKWLDKRTRMEMTNAEGKAAYIAHVLDGPTLGVPLIEV